MEKAKDIFEFPRLVLVADEPLTDPETGKITREALVYKTHSLVYIEDAPMFQGWLKKQGFLDGMLWMHEQDYHTYQGFHTTLVNAIENKLPLPVINQIRIEAIWWIESVKERLSNQIAKANND